MKRSFQTRSTAPSLHIPTGLLGPKEISSAKRRKFMDLKNAHLPSCRADPDADADASSIPIGRTQGVDPKTFEYAYFKKLKKDARQSFCPLLKEDDQLKKVKSVDCSKDTKNMAKNSNEDPKSSLHINGLTPINSNLFLSPHECPSKNSGIDLKEACTLVSDTYSMLKNTEECGTQCYEEAFSRKRHKLRQWVDVSFPEIDIICSKGYDFISVLLGRLSPRPSENKSSMGQHSQPMHIDRKLDLLDFSEPYTCSKELQINSVQKSRGLETRPHFNVSSSFCHNDKSREEPLWKWNLGSDPLTCSASKFPLLSENPEYDLDGERSLCLLTENDPTSSFSFEKYELVVSSHLKEVDEFRDQKEQMLRREPHSLLLDWDFGSMKDDRILGIASPNMEHNKDSMLPILLADDNWHRGDIRFDASVWLPSSFLSYTSLAHSYSDSYPKYDNGQHSPEERKCLIAKLHHFPLTLTPCCNPNEDCTNDIACKYGNSFCSQDYHWLMSMIFNEKHRLGLEALLLSSGFDFDLRQKQLLLADYPGENHSSAYQALQFPRKEWLCSNFLEDEFMSWLKGSNEKETLVHFPGDMLNIHDRSPNNLLMSLKKENAWPLLLGESRWAVSEAEFIIEDFEGKHT